ncbi:MAG: MarR family transcriptional regulator [Alphaproteobacteria bacterium]|nr:MarR family transcriptional regulator [Alphaproteobacteria bacterium]
MSILDRSNLGFLLAKATQRWNEHLYERFCAAGFPEVRPSYGSILVPLFEEDGLRIGELAKRARLSKQAMTTMLRLLEKEDLVIRRPDPEDARAARVYLTSKSKRFRPVAEAVLKELDALAKKVAGKQAHDDVAAWLRQFIEF